MKENLVNNIDLTKLPQEYLNNLKEIEIVFGSIQNFINEVPEKLRSIVIKYIKSFYTKVPLDQLKDIDLHEIIKESIKYAIRNRIAKRDLDSLIEYTRYLKIEEAIPNIKVRNFINKCGLNLLQTYNKKNNNFLDISESIFNEFGPTLLDVMAEHSPLVSLNSNINTEEELNALLNKIIHEMRKNHGIVDYQYLKMNHESLLKIFPKQFLDYDLYDKTTTDQYLLDNKNYILGKLQEGFDGDTDLLFEFLGTYPKLIILFQNKEIILSSKKDSIYQRIINNLGQSKFLELCVLYGKVFPMLIKNLHTDELEFLINELSNNNDIYKVIDERIYEKLISKVNLDVRILPNSFKKSYPGLYIDENAPIDLINRFYNVSSMQPYEITKHPEWIPYLLHVDIDKCFTEKKVSNEAGEMISIYKILLSKFTQKEVLILFAKYGNAILRISKLNSSLDKNEFYNNILDKIYKLVVNETRNFNRKNFPLEFKMKYPDVYIDEKAPEELKNAVYFGPFYPEDIKKHPEWIKYLIDKNLVAIFDGIRLFIKDAKKIGLSNEEILLLFVKYGKYLTNCNVRLIDSISEDISSNFYRALYQSTFSDWRSELKKGNISDIHIFIRSQIFYAITEKGVSYDEEVKDIFGNSIPDLFLDEDAPIDLKNSFYGINGEYLDFYLLNKHPEWISYLKGKAIYIPLTRKTFYANKMKNYFETFGEDDALKLGMRKPETVMKMVKAGQIDLMFFWYNKTGHKFIPDFVVMQTFPVDEADKFLVSSSNWSKLLKIENFSSSEESRTALLKLAYSFGVFDHDEIGFKKLQNILTELPRTIKKDYRNMINTISNSSVLEDLRKILKEENFIVDENEKNLLKYFYRINEDGSYTLIINQQSYPKSCAYVRNLFERYSDSPVLNPDKIHRLFGGFNLEYNKDFREFLLANLDTILETPEYSRYISNIQKQFTDIKAVNSNRTLTLDLAVSYVLSNKYQSVAVGNEKVAEISAIAGYSQIDFEILQQIYNYGKQRTFSSIPRIENKTGKYTYEMLRLDDPLALAIGTLTDCCQELGNTAELCMQHSMVDKNGRVFVIKDKKGSILAQSWVWRNKNVLCFDNIEVPTKVLDIHGEGITDEIFNIYKNATKELIEKDEKVYKELLEQGKITKEQYDGLRLSKVTVGLGYNDIAESIKRNSNVDDGKLSHPLPFEEPVKLSRGLYTSDSITQYVLEQKEYKGNYNGETLTPYNDSYLEYDDSNITIKDFLHFKKLESITKNGLLSSYDIDYIDKKHIVTELSNTYGLNAENTKIIMNPNFAIIYDIEDNIVRIGDLVLNTKIEYKNQNIDIRKSTMMQIKLALLQISKGMDIDISRLDENQIEIYNEALSLDMNIERGISHAR